MVAVDVKLNLSSLTNPIFNSDGNESGVGTSTRRFSAAEEVVISMSAVSDWNTTTDNDGWLLLFPDDCTR